MLGIDPWNYTESAIEIGPEVCLRLKDHHEFGMSSPLLGQVEISPSQHRIADIVAGRYFGGPPFWDEEQRIFLIPEWRTYRINRLFGGIPKDWQQLFALDMRSNRYGTHSFRFRYAHILSLQDEKITVRNTSKEVEITINLGEFSWQTIS